MGRHQKKKKKSLVPALVLVAVLAVLAALAATRLSHDAPPADTSEPAQSTAAPTPEPPAPDEETEEIKETEETEPPSPTTEALEFPFVLSDGRLKVESLFQFSGVNPDAGGEKATDTAAIVLTNTSGEYLESALFSAVLADGTRLSFAVSDLPGGASVMAFAVDNSPLAPDAVCVELSAEAVFGKAGSSGEILVSAAGTELTLENVSGAGLYEIEIYCRDIFGDKYFGGVSYKYTLDALAAGEKTVINASDCILGTAEVVRIVVNDRK